MSERSYPYRMKVGPLPDNHSYPFEEGEIIVLLGEISNMLGHFVILLPDGCVLSGLHDDYFVELQ